MAAGALRSGRARHAGVPGGEGTLVLETRWDTPEGTATVTDFMPVGGRSPHLERLVRGLRGEVPFMTELVLRFDNGGTVPWVTRLAGNTGVRAIAGPQMVLLHSPVVQHGRDLRTVGKFAVREGAELAVVLSHSPSHQQEPPAGDARAGGGHGRLLVRTIGALLAYR